MGRYRLYGVIYGRYHIEYRGGWYGYYALYRMELGELGRVYGLWDIGMGLERVWIWLNSGVGGR
jgi:hypothetical protein